MRTRLLPLLGLALLALAARSSAADQLPADVEAIPSDSALLFSIRVAALYDSDAGKKLVKDSPKAAEDLNKELRGGIGCDLALVERITVVASDIGNTEPIILVTTRKAVDKAAILKALLPEAKEEKRKDKVIYTQKDTRPYRREQFQGLHFVNDKFYVAGLKQDIEHWLDRSEDKPGVMAPARQAAAKNHLVVALNIDKVNTAMMEFMPAEFEPYKALFAGKVGLIVANLDKTTARVEATLNFSTEKDAAEGLKAGNELLKLARTGLAEAGKTLPKEFKGGPLEKLLTQAQEGLKEAKIEQKEKILTGTGSAGTDVDTLTKGAALLFAEIRASSARSEITNRVRQITIAMHNYHDTNGTFPPAAVYNKEGKALLSWRVLLLPYIGEDKLYKEFKLDEPWDSDHNKKLLARMPDVYKMGGVEGEAANKANETYFQVFTGKDTIFPGAKALPITKISDGTSNTILIVEANKAVAWTKPEDLPYDAKKALPKLGFSRAGYFIAGYADGSVRSHKQTIKEENLRLRITPNDGQPVPAEDEGGVSDR